MILMSDSLKYAIFVSFLPSWPPGRVVSVSNGGFSPPRCHAYFTTAKHVKQRQTWFKIVAKLWQGYHIWTNLVTCTHFRTTTQTATNPPLHGLQPVRRGISLAFSRFNPLPIRAAEFLPFYYDLPWVIHRLSSTYPQLIHSLSTGLMELSTGYPHVIHTPEQKPAIPSPLNPLSLSFILLYCYIVIYCYILLYCYVIMLYCHCWVY